MIRQKGTYSILSAFFLVIVIIAVAILLIAMNSLTAITKDKFLNVAADYEFADDIKSRLEECYKGFSDAKLSSPRDCGISQLQGYSISTIDIFNCPKKKWEFGKNENCKAKYSYVVDVSFGRQVCLARLALCR